MVRYDPRGRRNRAVLVGVSSYRHLPDLRGVSRNLSELHDALTAAGIGVFRDREVTVTEPRKPHDFIDAVKEAGDSATDLLLLYFAGHGRVHTDGSSFTFMVGESRENPGDRAAPYLDSVSWTKDILPYLRRAHADRIVIILDCCHSGNAVGEFDAGDHKPMYLLAAVQPNREIPSGDGTSCTPFTAELVRLLKDGLPDERELEGGVTFARLAHALAQVMREKTTVSGDVWRPQSLQVHAPDDVVLSFAPLDVGDMEIPLRVRLRTRWNDFTDWVRKKLGKIPKLLLTGAAVLGLLVTASAIGVAVRIAGGHACPTPLELRLLTDAETQPTLAAASDAYIRSEDNQQPLTGRPEDSEGCRQVNVTVYSAPAGSAVRGFREAGEWADAPDGCPTTATAGKNTGPGSGTKTAFDGAASASAARCFSPSLDVGPQPDIWVPASSADVTRAESHSGSGAATLSKDRPPLAYSPVVVGIPDALRGKLKSAGTGRTGATVAQIAGALRANSGGPDAYVQRPDPDADSAALLATVGLYRNGSGGQTGDTARSGLERHLASLGSPRDTDTALLCRLADRKAVDAPEQKVAAAVISEHSLARFNRRDGKRPVCAGATLDKRTAYYPKDVPVLDHPFVQVNWSAAHKDARQRGNAVGRLRDWLRGAAGQKYFTDAGYRGAGPHGRALAPPHRSLLARDGDATLQAPPLPPGTFDADTLDTALGHYQDALGPAKVLFVADTSSSMSSRWPTALTALQNSVAALGPRDDYGIWTTPGRSGGNHHQLAPLGGEHSDTKVQKKLATLKPDSPGARIAPALRAALDAVRRARGSANTPRLIVLITDDEDEQQIGRRERSDLVGFTREQTKRAGTTLAVVSLRTIGCDGDALDAQLADAGRGPCLDLSGSPARKLPEEVAKVGSGETQ